MSNSHIFMPSGFIRTPLQNGLGRYIPQLQRITLKFCKNHGGSRGVRDFIESDLMDFAKSNPGTVVYLKPRRHRSPCAVAEYLNGEREYLSLHEFTRDEVQKWLSYMRTRSGIPTMRFRKYQHTDYPTIQGVWNPFTHQAAEINTAEFPHEDLSKPVNLAPSATEQLIEIFKRSQITDSKEKPDN
uniref:Large ribosomal subunit protein mL43 n=1 Tax=Simocephalus serrulatus TaxID=117539 RepID=A0A4Y7NP63_9CRUS|nr:EOG090X0FS9 [Simocephalus serrulatus]SVE94563.1 EOG090X0FS9 [Simocephalus serrulatus]